MLNLIEEIVIIKHDNLIFQPVNQYMRSNIDDYVDWDFLKAFFGGLKAKEFVRMVYNFNDFVVYV